MNWIEFHPAKIQRLQKFSDLMDSMGWGVNETLGFLGNLWGQVIELHEDGDLTGWRPGYIARLTSTNADPEALVRALKEARWLKEYGGRVLIYNWIEYAGRFLRGKYGSGKNQENTEELERIWAIHGLVYGKESKRRAQGEQKESKRAATLPNRTLPNLPDLPNQQVPDAGGAGVGKNSKAVKIAERLRDLIFENDAGARISKDLGVWAREADKMLRLDKRGIAEIMRVMEWALKDSFWKGNILSIHKFREKFTQLKLKMPEANGGGARPYNGPKCPRCSVSGPDFKLTETSTTGDKICPGCKTREEVGLEDGKPLPRFKTVARKKSPPRARR